LLRGWFEESCGVTCVGDSCKYFAEGLGVEGLVRLSCGIEDSEVEDFVEDLRSPLDGLEDEDGGCGGGLAHWLVYC
jgi:hypothetical protein